jgi:hypothetical protein
MSDSFYYLMLTNESNDEEFMSGEFRIARDYDLSRRDGNRPMQSQI